MSFFGWLFASQYYASAPIVVDSKISAQPREPGWVEGGRGVTNTLITSLIIVQKHSRLAFFRICPSPRSFLLTVDRTSLVGRGNRSRVLLATLPVMVALAYLGTAYFYTSL